MAENFPQWNPLLNRRHFPRSADSEWVAVAAGQLSDGTIVPIQTTLVDGTTNQYALTVNTEITLPPITIGNVVIKGKDFAGTDQFILTTPNIFGKYDLSVSSPNLALEASQLTQINLLNLISQELTQLSVTVGDVNVNTDELELLTRLVIATTADGITLILGDIQSSTASLQDGITDLKIELLEGLTNIVNLNAQEVSQLSQLIFQGSSSSSQQVTQLSDIGVLLSQEVSQLSSIEDKLYDGLTDTSVFGEKFIKTTDSYTPWLTQYGKRYTTSVEYNFPNQNEIDAFLLRNPLGSGKRVHISEVLLALLIRTNNRNHVRFYVGPTVSVSGTTLTIVPNITGGSQLPSVVRAYSGPTISSRGTAFRRYALQESNTVQAEWKDGHILEEGADLLITGESDANNRSLAITTVWEESNA